MDPDRPSRENEALRDRLSRLTFNGPRCLSLSCFRKVSDVPALLFPSSSIHSTSPVSRHTAE